MGFLKALTIITLWLILSFVWVSMGQSQVRRDCEDYGSVESWIANYPVLNDWYHYFVERNSCQVFEKEFFKALASSEPLSTKLNQAKVRFNQFYIPLDQLLSINWGNVSEEETQNIQSNLASINYSIQQILLKMSEADGDYFRATVLLELPSDYVQLAPESLSCQIPDARCQMDVGIW